MFSGNQKEATAKALDLSIEELDSFIRRLRGYINIHIRHGKVSNNVLIAGLWLIDDVRKRSLEERLEKRKAINFGNMKNEYLRKYGLEILELKDSGYGAMRISKHLKVHHNADVSKATIERFIKLNEVDHG